MKPDWQNWSQLSQPVCAAMIAVQPVNYFSDYSSECSEHYFGIGGVMHGA